MGTGAKVLWAEGYLFGAQHFQQQDRYHELSLKRMAAAHNPHFWGARVNEWRAEALEHGSLAAEQLSLIFPDGALYDAPGTDRLPTPVDLSRLPSDVQEFTFCAALPLVQSNESSARYVQHQAQAHDLYGAAPPMDVVYLVKQPRLLSQLESLDGYVVVPLVRIRRKALGGFVFDPDFVPPSVSVDAAPCVRGQLERLISTLLAKADDLKRAQRQPNGESFELHAGQVTSWWMLNVVSDAAASLLHAARSEQLHPERLYECLLALAGKLCAFSARIGPADLPAYDHGAPGPVFARLDGLIRELLDTSISARCFQIELLRDENRRTHYRGRLDPERVSEKTQLCLAVRADMPALELVAAVPLRVKIGSPEDIERIVASALPGVPLTHMPQVPAAVPVRPSTYYFSLASKGPLYESMLKSGEVAIYAPDGMQGLQCELLGVNP
ncbi:MAG TPA: type VI secretion system baseplate subunit TssK [Telluria sp.]|nr:type VI secretion system baseplate subunit TssK [Telluria sp.]